MHELPRCRAQSAPPPISFGASAGVSKRMHSGTYLWHWGDNGIFKAYVVADIQRRSAVVLFDNRAAASPLRKLSQRPC